MATPSGAGSRRDLPPRSSSRAYGLLLRDWAKGSAEVALVRGSWRREGWGDRSANHDLAIHVIGGALAQRMAVAAPLVIGLDDGNRLIAGDVVLLEEQVDDLVGSGFVIGEQMARAGELVLEDALDLALHL